jgi:2-haloacid dehalogenase
MPSTWISRMCGQSASTRSRISATRRGLGFAVVERWATFDCYGTLVDWNGGIGAELEKLFGVEHAEQLLHRYHELEPEIQAASPGSSYREVLTVALERLADEAGLTLPEGEASALARSLPSWPVFDDVRPALSEARERGWRLAILSNTDRDLIDASIRAIAVPFGAAIVAGDIGSYKPARRHWDAFREHTRSDPARHVHVAQSLYHDIATTSELGIPSIWINRLGEPADPRPARTLPSLSGLAEALDAVASGDR